MEEDPKTDREEEEKKETDTDTDLSEEEKEVFDDDLQPIETQYTENLVEELGQVRNVFKISLIIILFIRM